MPPGMALEHSEVFTTLKKKAISGKHALQEQLRWDFPYTHSIWVLMPNR